MITKINIIAFFKGETLENGLFHKMFDKYISNISRDDVTITYIDFDVTKIDYSINGEIINIKDDSQSISISDKENKTTLIWHRFDSFKQNSAAYELFNYLIFKKFIVINPINPTLISSNKWKLYNLLNNYSEKIPQPKTVHILPSDISEEANSETIKKVFKPIYGNTNDDNEYVIKILDGHGGTGVFMCNMKNALSILQSLHKIDPTRDFIAQEKRDGKNGDIRVHVFTFQNKQFIACAFKRIKLNNDFRSNICLGANIELIKLTKEQEQIALNVAKASGLIWVGVDIMECKDGSNVVLEYNDNAGGFTDYVQNGGDNVFVNTINNLIDIILNVSNNNIISEAKLDKKLSAVMKEIDSITTTNNYKFNKIVSFSGTNNAEVNDVLRYLNAISKKNKNVTIHNLIGSTVDFEKQNNKIKLFDKNHTLTLDKDDVKNTIIITRLSIMENENGMKAVDELEKMGFIILNPINGCKTASNKYETAKLLSKHNIPQPNFVLLTKDDILEGEKTLTKQLKNVYKDIEKISKEKKENLKYVVKILDGHGGTGVFKTNGDDILGIIQTIFAINENTKLLVQKYEKSKGGDIRVHVLTFKGKQFILGAMKRNKLNTDFRSNVSLGATTSSVKLTDEQKKIVLKTAEISGLPWCAVDLMEIEHGYDKEVGDNVVLEINDSAGLEGISTQLNKNLLSIILDYINDLM